MKRSNSKFIVFEGLDGSGQSTQAELLKQDLENKKIPVVLTKEPTNLSPEGREIREILQGKKKKDPAEFQELYVKDRKKHLENLINPSLEAGKTVISDRYFFSTIAFGGLSSDMNWLMDLNRDFPTPDMVFFLDVLPEICVDRIKSRGKKVELFERKDKLEKIYQNYKKCFQNFKNIYFINGEENKEEVSGEIKNVLHQILNLKS
jgi:dTMP kinase